jgi:anti-anti-sigma factor
VLAHPEVNSGELFTIEQTLYGSEVLVFSLAGELDLAVIETARAVLEPASSERTEIVVIDLAELEFLDSSGVALLYTLARVRPDTNSLQLLPSRHDGVNRMLELTGVGSVIPIAANSAPTEPPGP